MTKLGLKLLLAIGVFVVLATSSVLTVWAAEENVDTQAFLCWKKLPVISSFVEGDCQPFNFQDFIPFSKQFMAFISQVNNFIEPATESSETGFSVGINPADLGTTSSDVTLDQVESPSTSVVNAAAGYLSYLAGDGIQIAGSTISNTDAGSAQSILKSIKVDDQDTISFSGNNDSLELEAGSNISISTNGTDKKITITGSPGDTYGSIYETSGNIGIGTSTPATKLDVVGDVTISANNRLLLSANNALGNITRSITLTSNNKYDRPWISHIDYTGRHAASFGVHHTNVDNDDIHKRWELKTSADPNGSQPNVMLTRFAIDYDTDTANIIFGDIATIGTHNDYGDRAIFVHNMKTEDGSQSINVGQWTSELGAGDSTVMSFAPKTLANDSDAYVRFFRETETTGERKLVVMKGDNTATETFTVNAATGLITTFANAEAIKTGDGTNTSSYLNFQSNRAISGYDGSYAVLQGGTSKGVKLNVNNSSFGQGTLMTLTPEGRVGINTIEPAALFSVGSSSGFQVDNSGNLTAASASVSGALTLNAATNIQTTRSQTLTLGGSTTGAIALMPKNGTGRVGIGTTSPGAPLHIALNSETLRLGDNTNTSSFVNVQSNRTMFGYDGSFAVVQGGTSKGVKLNVNNSSFGQGTVVTIQSDGDVGFGVDPTQGPIDTATGAYLSVGGVWENNSDVNLKENFYELDPAEVLEKINQLWIPEWNYIVEGAGVRHIGPIAQDFYAAFGLNNNDRSVSTIDPAGVALVGIKGLSNEVTDLKSRVSSVEGVEPISESKVKTIFGDEFLARGLTISDNILILKKTVKFERLVSFVGRVVFEAGVEFMQAPLFSRETAGVAVVKAGADRVEVVFERSYSVAPQVSVTPNQAVASGDDVAGFFNQDFKYVVGNVTTDGFTIYLNQAVDIDLGFSWIAIAVKEPRVSVSEELISPIPDEEVVGESSDSSQEVDGGEDQDDGGGKSNSGSDDDSVSQTNNDSLEATDSADVP